MGSLTLTCYVLAIVHGASPHAVIASRRRKLSSSSPPYLPLTLREPPWDSHPLLDAYQSRYPLHHAHAANFLSHTFVRPPRHFSLQGTSFSGSTLPASRLWLPTGRGASGPFFPTPRQGTPPCASEFTARLDYGSTSPGASVLTSPPSITIHICATSSCPRCCAFGYYHRQITPSTRGPLILGPRTIAPEAADPH